MDVSTTFGTAFSQIINGSGVGTVYTVPANKCVLITVSKEVSSVAGYSSESMDIVSSELTLTIGGTLVQKHSATVIFNPNSGNGYAGGNSVAGAAGPGQAITIGHSGNGAVRYQILEFNVVTT